MSRPPNKDISIHKLLLGTHSFSEDPSIAEPNFLMIADVSISYTHYISLAAILQFTVQVSLPNPNVEIDVRQYNDESGEVVRFNKL